MCGVCTRVYEYVHTEAGEDRGKEGDEVGGKEEEEERER